MLSQFYVTWKNQQCHHTSFLKPYQTSLFYDFIKWRHGKPNDPKKYIFCCGLQKMTNKIATIFTSCSSSTSLLSLIIFISCISASQTKQVLHCLQSNKNSFFRRKENDYKVYLGIKPCTRRKSI